MAYHQTLRCYCILFWKRQKSKESDISTTNAAPSDKKKSPITATSFQLSLIKGLAVACTPNRLRSNSVVSKYAVPSTTTNIATTAPIPCAIVDLSHILNI